MTTSLNLDERLTTFLSYLVPHSTTGDSIFAFFSFQGLGAIAWIGIPIVLLATSLIIYRQDKARQRKCIMIAAHFMAAIVISFLIVTVVLKPLVERSRPTVTVSSSSYHCPVDYSFPSGHAAVAFAGLGVVTYWDKNRKRQLLYWVIALAITYSRLYLGCHYLSDVVVGGAIGYTISRMLPMIMRYQPKTASV